ncbi:hypothetical protein [Amycolatopsis sp. H20-H5]|uniref:hypothetical protein n=1 Tax=Amycolatopsis sp. H20-H5 TaxID=3046309 RepID=UPI002DB5EEE6|nr:hypothetical protein [Amycolatopsis sp. H20-H5]MEC3981931.1 hypothetical protein [Amycolatopsis sp. H20-H5]
MTTIKQLAEERRLRSRTAPQTPPTQAGEQWGTCVGVYDMDGGNASSRVRKVARVLLASGFVVTAYFAANSQAPVVDAPVLVAVGSIGDCPVGCVAAVTAAGGDQPVERYTIVEY